MQFLQLPDDKIVEICENLDQVSLAKFMRTNERINNVCGFVLERRQNEHTEELIEKFAEDLTGIWESYFTFRNSTNLSIVLVYALDKNFVYIKQTLSDPRIPLFLPNLQKYKDYYSTRLPKTLESLLLINNALVDQNYTKIIQKLHKIN